MKRLTIIILPLLLSACAATQDYTVVDDTDHEFASDQKMEMFVYPDTPGHKRSRSYGHKLEFPLYKAKPWSNNNAQVSSN